MAASLPAQRAPLPGCASPELQSAARQALQRDLPGAQLREFEPVPKYTSDIMVACTARLTAPARDQRTALTLRRGGADQWAIAFDL
jgi:hypothetical protein